MDYTRTRLAPGARSLLSRDSTADGDTSEQSLEHPSEAALSPASEHGEEANRSLMRRTRPARKQPESPEFAERLKWYRVDAKLSQNKLAELAWLDHSYISRLEDGNRKPTFEVVTALLRALGISKTSIAGKKLYHSAGFTVGGEILPEEIPESFREFFELFPDMLPSERTILDHMLRTLAGAYRETIADRKREADRRVTRYA
jgi:transcriptional regulator with XRE-family HTH domain